MKTIFAISTLSFLFICYSYSSAQKNVEIKDEQVPKAVKDAFHTETMSVTADKWVERTLEDGQVRYMAYYKEANFNARLLIKSDGTKLRRVYTGMFNGPFNTGCDDNALKQFPGYAIKTYEMVYVFANQKRYYRDILYKGKQKAVYICDEEGNPAKLAEEED